MPRTMRLHFIVSVMLLGGVTTTLAAFISTPTSVNVTLGSTATFNCSATTGTPAWMVNGTLLTELLAPDIHASQVGHAFFLNVPAEEKYNNTNVTCAVAILGGDDLYSDPVVLRVQGPPANLSNLEGKSLDQTICLTWDAPFSLDITGVDPDIWYHIDIAVDIDPFNTSSVNIPFISFPVNISEFNFTMDDYNDTSTSVIYEFRVTPINGAGTGPQSEPVTGYFSGPPTRLAAEMVKASADSLNVNITIEYGNILPGEMPDRFQVHTETNDGGKILHYCSDEISVIPDIAGRVFIELNTNDSSNLKPYRKYHAVITARNDFGVRNSTGEIQFSTHEVQTCAANNCSTGGRVNISCNFTENSEAKGYLSILCPKRNSSQEMFVVAIRKDTSSSDLEISVPGVPPDSYDVVVFDLGRNGLPPGDTNYAAEEEENITVTNPGEGGDDVVSVNGTFLRVPDNADGEVKLCVSFKSNSHSSSIIVLAHHVDDPKNLTAYNLITANCTTAPPPGGYFFGLFTQNGSHALKEPATSLTISFAVVPIMSPIPSTPPITAMIDPTPSLLVTVVSAVVPLAVLVIAMLIVFVVLIVHMKNRRRKRFTIVTYRGVLSDYEEPSSSPSTISSGTPTIYSVASISPLIYSQNNSASPVSTPNHRITQGQEAEQAVVPDYGDEKAKSGVHYAEVETVGGIQKPPSLDDGVQYQTVLSQAKPAYQPPPPVAAKRHVTINPPSSQPCSVNLENLITALHAVTSKWQQLGEALGMDEDLVDEIWTNNNGRDEECLKNFLDMWVMKSPTWNDVTTALQKIGEDELAGSLYVKYVLPGIMRTSPVHSAKLPLVTDEVVGSASLESPLRVPSNSNQPKTTSTENGTNQDALQNDSTPPVETAFQESASHVNYLSPDKNCDDVSSQNGTITQVLQDAKEEEGEEGNLSVNDDRYAHKGFNQSEKSKGSSAVLMAFSTLQYPCDASLGEIPLCGHEKQYLMDQTGKDGDAIDCTTDSQFVQGKTFCSSSQILHSCMVQRKQIPVLSFVAPTLSTTWYYRLLLARVRSTRSGSPGFNKTSSNTIYTSDATTTCDFVGAGAKQPMAVLHNDVEADQMKEWADVVEAVTQVEAEGELKAADQVEEQSNGLKAIMQVEAEARLKDGVTAMVETKFKQDSACPETRATHFESSFVRKSLPFHDNGQKLTLRLRIPPKSSAVGEDKSTHRSSVNSRWWSSTGELATSSNPLTVYQILMFCLLAMQSHCSIPGSKTVLIKQHGLEIRQAVMKAFPPLDQSVLKLALETCLVVFASNEVISSSFILLTLNYLCMDVMTSSLSHDVVENIYTVLIAKHQYRLPTHTMNKIANPHPTVGVTSLLELLLLPTYNAGKRASQSVLSSPIEQRKSSLSQQQIHTHGFLPWKSEEEFLQLKLKLIRKQCSKIQLNEAAAQSSSNSWIPLASKKFAGCIHCEVTKMQNTPRSNPSSCSTPSTSLQSQIKLNTDEHQFQPSRSNNVYDVPPSPVPLV